MNNRGEVSTRSTWVCPFAPRRFRRQRSRDACHRAPIHQSDRAMRDLARLAKSVSVAGRPDTDESATTRFIEPLSRHHREKHDCSGVAIGCECTTDFGTNWTSNGGAATSRQARAAGIANDSYSPVFANAASIAFSSAFACPCCWGFLCSDRTKRDLRSDTLNSFACSQQLDRKTAKELLNERQRIWLGTSC